MKRVLLASKNKILIETITAVLNKSIDPQNSAYYLYRAMII